MASTAGDDAVAQIGNSTATGSARDQVEKWPAIRLHPDEAAAYISAEIIEWFKERGIDTEARRARAERERRKLRHVPWYHGGYKGVRVDKAIMHHLRILHESFRTNPYGLGAKWFWFILLAQILFLLGNVGGGIVDALNSLGDDNANHWLPVIKGGVSALPVVWMLTMTLFPPLIANVKDQFAVFGYKIDV